MPKKTTSPKEPVAEVASKAVLETKAKTKTKAKKAEVKSETVTNKPAAETKTEAPVADTPTESVGEEKTSTRKTRTRTKRYQAARAKIDQDKLYSLADAVKLVKETSLSKFEGKIEAHLLVTDIGNMGEIVFPHLDAASKKIVILNDTILAQIKDGQLDFDILIATPATMPKLLPFARALGPKGLMPNPKNGTLTDKPEEAVKRLSVAKAQIKTEKKAPVIHIVVGKTKQEDKEIVANVEELIKVIKAPRVKKLTLCATMGPSVKVKLA